MRPTIIYGTRVIMMLSILWAIPNSYCRKKSFAFYDFLRCVVAKIYLMVMDFFLIVKKTGLREGVGDGGVGEDWTEGWV